MPIWEPVRCLIEIDNFKKYILDSLLSQIEGFTFLFKHATGDKIMKWVFFAIMDVHIWQSAEF